MMLKMMNPFGSVTDALPSVGGGDSEDSGVSKEEAEEQEKMRKDAIQQAEKERRDKYKKQEDARETTRQTIRDKYQIEKKVDSDAEDEDDEDDDFGGGGPKKAVDDDPVAQAKAEAEKRMNEAKQLAGDKCSIQ